VHWVLNFVYGCLGLLILPYWLWKLPTAERYRAGIRDRLGFAPVLQPRPRLWIHCASVGEASIPRRLVAGLGRTRPGLDIVFSTNTDTGARRLRELYAGHTVFYMPFDFSFAVRRALDRVRPQMVFLVELEFWPNLAHECGARNLPLAIINGRIGRRSAQLLRVLHKLWPSLWDPVHLCCARSQQDVERFHRAGMPPERATNCGSLKFDALRTEPDEARRAELAALFGLRTGQPVLVAGSTHAGEEGMLAFAYRTLRPHHQDLRLIVVPRHVERAGETAAAFRARGLRVVRRTNIAPGGPPPDDAVIVVDTIGELAACYSLASCAFVGRSLVPPGGGQNMMEPAALGVPVVVGPYTGNFRPEMQLLQRHDAVVVVRDRASLTEAIGRLLDEPDSAHRLGLAARRVILDSQGATQRTLAALEPLLSSQPQPA
jgi:3-deoxy-D-manno-octulosonic-acid transferase